jgi:hypothetical protein
LVLTEDDVEKGIDEARAGLKAAQADLLMAQLDRQRYPSLRQTGAGTIREQEESVRKHDSVLAHLELVEAIPVQAIASAVAVLRMTPPRSITADDNARTGPPLHSWPEKFNEDPRQDTSVSRQTPLMYFLPAKYNKAGHSDTSVSRKGSLLYLPPRKYNKARRSGTFNIANTSICITA